MRRFAPLAFVVLIWPAFTGAMLVAGGEGDDIVIRGERIDRSTETDTCRTVDLQVDALEDGTYLVADDVLTEKAFIELLKSRSNSDANFQCVEILMEPLDILRVFKFRDLDLGLSFMWTKRSSLNNSDK